MFLVFFFGGLWNLVLEFEFCNLELYLVILLFLSILERKEIEKVYWFFRFWRIYLKIKIRDFEGEINVLNNLVG